MNLASKAFNFHITGPSVVVYISISETTFRLCMIIKLVINTLHIQAYSRPLAVNTNSIEIHKYKYLKKNHVQTKVRSANALTCLIIQRVICYLCYVHCSYMLY